MIHHTRQIGREVAQARLFPVFSALWFAALLGLGSLAASPGALAVPVGALHLGAVIPAAAPPLGVTAHLLIAFAATLLGGVFGLGLGLICQRRVGISVPAMAKAAPRKTVVPASAAEPETAPPIVSRLAAFNAPRVRRSDAHPDAPPRRPLVVTQDVLPYPTSMTAFVPEQQADEAVADFVIPAVPQPESATVAAEPEPYVASADMIPLSDLPAHELPPFLAAAFAATQPAAPILPSIDTADAPQSVALAAHDDVAAPVAPPIQVAPVPLATLAVTAPQTPIAVAPLDHLGLVQLIERLALAIAARAERHIAEHSVDESASHAPSNDHAPHADPVVQFPVAPPRLVFSDADHAGSGTPEAADRALRDALATLRRISGPR